MKVVTAAQMRRIDERAQSEFGISPDDLMLEAGRAITRRLVAVFSPSTVLIMCGRGNNAGDGYVVAHELAIRGIDSTICEVAGSPDKDGPAARARAKLQAARVTWQSFDELQAGVAGRDVIVDALLGTGFTGQLKEHFAQAIRWMNGQPRPILAVDVPSGLGEGSGAEAVVAVRATLTVTIGAPKLSLLTSPGSVFAGRVLVEPINFPDSLLQDAGITVNVATTAELKPWLPERRLDSNKGTFGKVGVIAGSAPYAGAAILVARAALRSGCGLVFIATTAALNSMYKTALPEAVTRIVPSVDSGFLDDNSIDALAQMAGEMNAIAIGPGIGTAAPQQQLVARILRDCKTPAVVDADALTCVALNPACRDALQTRKTTIITPHPGELARLLGCEVAAIQSDRISAAREAAQEFGVTVLLKGASTLVAEPAGELHIVPGACSALAKGGTGDVLTGAIGSLMAQGCDPTHAAILAATAHLRAGIICATRIGDRGVLASEVADQLGREFAGLEQANVGDGTLDYA